MELPQLDSVRNSMGIRETPLLESKLTKNTEINSDKIKHQKRVSELKFKNKNSIKRNTYSQKRSINNGSGFSKNSLYKKKLSKENLRLSRKISTFNSHHTNLTSEKSNNSAMFRIENDEDNKTNESNISSEDIGIKNKMKNSDIKAQVLISGFNQQFGVSRFETGINKTQSKEKQIYESSFEEPEQLSEEGRI